jgi:hypothetical protein
MPERPVVVVGSTVAAFAAADAVARHGRPVALYAPRRGHGAGFVPLMQDGYQLPLGFRTLELVVDPDHPRPAPPLDDYVADVAGHRPYLGLLHRWFAELLGPLLRQLTPPQMYVDGRLTGDIYYTLDAAALSGVLSPDLAVRIADQAAGRERREGAAGVLSDPNDPALWRLGLDEASRRNHGTAFHHKFVQAMCEKILSRGCVDVPAALRRKVWMPLFWPQTVHQVATGVNPAWRPTHRRFHDSGALDPVSALQRRLSSSPLVRRIDVDHVEQFTVTGPRTTIRFGNGIEVSDEAPIVGIQPEMLFNAAGAAYRPDRVTSVLAWVDVDAEHVLHHPSVLMVVDPEIPAFRISTGGVTPRPGRVLFTVELSHLVDADRVAATASDVLRRTGLVRPGAPTDVVAEYRGLAFTAPTRVNHERFDVARARLSELGSRATIIGGGSTYGADSLNEQSIQGLYAAALAVQSAPLAA